MTQIVEPEILDPRPDASAVEGVPYFLHRVPLRTTEHIGNVQTTDDPGQHLPDRPIDGNRPTLSVLRLLDQ